MNSNFEISYRVSAGTVLLFSSGGILVTNAMALIDGSMYGHNITNATYFVEGVTIAVTVTTHDSNGQGYGPSVTNTTMAQGSKCMAVRYTDLSHSLSSPSPLSHLFRSLSLSLSFLFL